jgi:hypothetical protein
MKSQAFYHFFKNVFLFLFRATWSTNCIYWHLCRPLVIACEIAAQRLRAEGLYFFNSGLIAWDITGVPLKKSVNKWGERTARRKKNQ